ncbi:S41 family peptidase [Seonamhaeicola marinus]|uniref:Peptidase S41 n=1 Tax=Seonamhaeicola marinus TaxID=1912246 RepID=A0A5D0JAS9_9FLAO|nr:S41 family peptidase [Seonamhaeicola marinus]TYA92220.1 peptidase S41 [Seonamhaeicola marinus]
MKKTAFKLSHVLLFLSFSLFLVNCSTSDDDSPKEPETPDTPEPVTLNNPIHNFVWSGLNEVYLWQQDVPNLADNKKNVQDDYFTFLNGYNSPETLFDGMLYQPGTVDKFSFLVDDYVALENSFQGISLSNGVDFGLVRFSGSDDIFGYVRYIANDSDASAKNIKRGDLFLEVNGQQLTISNYRDLLFGQNNTYTLGLASISNNTISLTGTTVELTKSEFTENPILKNKVLEIGGSKIGYLMYNSFVADFDDELNTAISELKNAGITDLVLDLRYNPGGRVSSAIILSSMITGQFYQQIFSKEIWNNKYQAYFEANAPDRLINRFTNTLLDDTPITSLNLNKVYVLTTDSSASASELVINGLSPYIDVVQIGTATTGKYTASITLYDSSDFGKENANPAHTYALQPLVLKSANADDVTDYTNGLIPDHIITYNTSNGVAEGEDLANLGILGDENEPFLAKAIELITGSTTKRNITKSFEKLSMPVEHITNTKEFAPAGNEMYIDTSKLIE